MGAKKHIHHRRDISETPFTGASDDCFCRGILHMKHVPQRVKQ